MAGEILIAEGVKFLLQIAFAEARKAGLSKEQIDRLYIEEKDKFAENSPAKIPEV